MQHYSSHGLNLKMTSGIECNSQNLGVDGKAVAVSKMWDFGRCSKRSLACLARL